MKKLAIMTTALVVLGGVAVQAQAPTTTTTTTTVQTPVGTATTTTDVTAPVQQVPAQVVPQQNVPTARDAITGEPIDAKAPKEEESSLRDKVRNKISDEAAVKQ